jgi:DUF4097 and DUF4098 domain-containing protein YvlB
MVAAAFLLPAAAFAQNDLSSPREVFKGEVESGAWLRIRTMKGNIEVREGSGRTAVVTAVRGRGRGSAESVTFDVKRDGASITVCAIYPHTQRCDANNYESGWRRGDSDLAPIDFKVSLPKGVKLVAATGNGEIDVRNAGAEVRASSGNGEVSVLGAGGRVDASSGNGDIKVSDAKGDVSVSSGNGDLSVGTTKGPVSASTGNGRIDVKMETLTEPGDMEFSTGNGSINLTLPANLSAEVIADVSLRNFETDFPMQLPGHFSGRRIQGKIGEGGRRIKMSTGNGSVTLRKI